MDRLRHAAEDGDIDELYNCIRDEVDVQRYIDGDDIDHFIDQTPLHITATKGHVDFAMALIYIKPSWGTKLNQEMYSPMHLAIRNWNDELVLALLAVDKDLVRVKGKDGYTALHYATENDNLELLAHFLKDCPECLEDVTIRNETALHVAARNSRLEALQILARYTQRMYLYCTISKRHILNSKDRDGNTVLHIAASDTQPEMIRVLLECQANKTEMNKAGLLYIVSSGSTFVALLFEFLLSLFIGCLLLAEQVVEPHDESGSIWTMKVALFFTFSSLCGYIAVTRLGTMAFHMILNPNPVSFFKRFFRDKNEYCNCSCRFSSNNQKNR